MIEEQRPRVILVDLAAVKLGRVLVPLPAWHRAASIALLCSLLVVPLLLAGPFSRIGDPDPDVKRRYRIGTVKSACALQHLRSRGVIHRTMFKDSIPM